MKTTNLVNLLAMAALAAIGTLSLQAQDQPPEEKKPRWESTATASLTLTRGNAETMLASLKAETGKKWDKNELKIGADGAYGETTTRFLDAVGGTTNSTTINVNVVRGFIQYNRLFTERLFGMVRVDGMHDEIAKIDFRVVASPGLGYYFIKKPATTLCGEVGPSYVWERLNGDWNNYAALRVADTFTHKLSDRAKVWQKTEVLPSLKDFSHVLVNSEVGVSASLTQDNKLALTVTLNHSYNSHPAVADPRRMRNDTILKAGITYAF
jgi:putative salt-induced outer membrane protein YdiY